MTTVHIRSGVCGFDTTVTVSKQEKRDVKLGIVSGCEKIDALGRLLKELSLKDVFLSFIKNPVYEKASRCGLHSSCPVPCGIVKGAEAELGMALPRNVTIEFVDGG